MTNNEYLKSEEHYNSLHFDLIGGADAEKILTGAQILAVEPIQTYGTITDGLILHIRTAGQQLACVQIDAPEHYGAFMQLHLMAAEVKQ